MGKRKDLSTETVAQIKILLSEGAFSLREIAARCHVSKSSVGRIKKEEEDGREAHINRHRRGQQLISSPTDDRSLLRNARANVSSSLNDLRQSWAESGVIASKTTVFRRLKNAGYKSVKPRRIPILTSAMKKKRLAFAMEHRHWTVDDWRKVCIYFEHFCLKILFIFQKTCVNPLFNLFQCV